MWVSNLGLECRVEFRREFRSDIMADFEFLVYNVHQVCILWTICVVCDWVNIDVGGGEFRDGG